MIHTHRPPLRLRSPLSGWVTSLACGDAAEFAAGVPVLSPDERFQVGQACAQEGLVAGLPFLLENLSTEDIQCMGIHWLETAILHSQFEHAEAVRATGLDPLAPFAVSRSFESAGLFQRRNAAASKWLEDLEGWTETFDDQWRRSRLPSLFLYRAIHHEPLATVAFLLDHGAALDSSFEACVPLWSALRAGKAPVINLLLARGAQVAAAGQFANKTLLVNAAERGLEDCVWSLVEAGTSLSDASCGIDAPCAARAAGHHVLASKMEEFLLQRQPQACSPGSPRRL